MERKKRGSRLTYRAILNVQSERDAKSGLYAADRYYEPAGDRNASLFLCILMDGIVPFLLLLGIMLLIVTGFSVPVSGWFYPVLFCITAGMAGFGRLRLIQKHPFLSGVSGLVIWLFFAFLVQDAFLEGAKQFIVLVTVTVNRRYAGTFANSFEVSGASKVQIFLIFVFILFAYWIFLSLFQVRQMFMIYLLVFPIVIFSGLCGAASYMPGLLLLLVGLILCKTSLQVRKQYRMWGGDRKELQQTNAIRFEVVQKLSLCYMFIIALVLIVPGYFLVRPALSVSLKPMTEAATQVQSSFLSKMVKLLPDISAGKWKLTVEAVSGGIDEGSLSSDEGYQISHMDDLDITIDQKPEETIFLKGFTGSSYDPEKDSWESGYGTGFDASAMNWKLTDSPRIYIQNLPFLRTSYVISKHSEEPELQKPELETAPDSPAEIHITRLNANDTYTYVPYGAYLDDPSYVIEGGDGAVIGMDKQDDTFYFYFRRDMEQLLSAWNQIENTTNVMDRTEESYRAYCEVNDLGNAPSGLLDIQNMIDETIHENGWKGQEDLDDITVWIRTYLAEHYTYQKIPDSDSSGTDGLTAFLFDTKAGNSVQFASAAVFFYRMCGIPARYVIGYELPAAAFSVQPDGSYHAIAQGEDSQAWVEIYRSGIGWVPEDMTPAVTGTYEEAGKYSELVEQPEKKKQSMETDKMSGQTDTGKKEQQNTYIHMRNIALSQIVFRLLYLCAALAFITGCILIARLFCIRTGRSFIRKRTPKERLLLVFRQIYRRLCRLGLPEGTDSQQEIFVRYFEEMIAQRVPAEVPSVQPAVSRLYEICFGGAQAEEQDVRQMRHLLYDLYKRCNHRHYNYEMIQYIWK